MAPWRLEGTIGGIHLTIHWAIFAKHNNFSEASMRIHTRILTILTLTLLTTSAVAQTVPVTILHYNDFHAANLPYTRVVRGDTLTMGGAANLAGYLDHFRETMPNALVLHAGDDFQGSPVSMLSKGRSQVDIMNAIGLDAFAVGNHEFDYTGDTLRERLSHASFPVLSANIADSATGKCIFTPDTVLTIDGVRIGVIGVVLDGLKMVTTAKATAGIVALDPEKAIRKSLDRLNPITDIQILLSHSGHMTDSVFAAEFGPELELIVGGHSHWRLWEPWVVNGVPIVQAGSKGEFVGMVQLDVDTVANSATLVKGELVRTLVGVYPPDSTVAAVVQRYEDEAGAELNVPIATLKSDWVRRNGESNLGNWVTDAFRATTGADIAIVNNHGLRKNQMAGPLTTRDILEIQPFSNDLIELTLTGEQVKQFATHLAKRGPVVNVSGMKLKARDGKLKKLRVNGKKVKKNKMYTLVAPNYVVDHLDNYVGLDPASVESKPLGIVDNNALIPYAEKQGEIDSKVEGRLDFGEVEEDHR